MRCFALSRFPMLGIIITLWLLIGGKFWRSSVFGSPETKRRQSNFFSCVEQSKIVSCNYFVLRSIRSKCSHSNQVSFHRIHTVSIKEPTMPSASRDPSASSFNSSIDLLMNSRSIDVPSAAPDDNFIVNGEESSLAQELHLAQWRGSSSVRPASSPHYGGDQQQVSSKIYCLDLKSRSTGRSTQVCTTLNEESNRQSRGQPHPSLDRARQHWCVSPWNRQVQNIIMQFVMMFMWMMCIVVQGFTPPRRSTPLPRSSISRTMTDINDKFTSLNEEFDQGGNDGNYGEIMPDLEWRVAKIKLEEANTQRFLKARIRFLPYADCRKWAIATDRFDCEQDWREFVSMGEGLNTYIPSAPDVYFTQLGQWISWDHFLGKCSDVNDDVGTFD